MKHIRRLLSLLLSLSMILLPLGSVQASMVGNGQLIGQSDRAELLQVLERDSARQQLSALGISQEQATLRIMQMTDQEVAQVNQHLADMPAGGDALGVILLIFLVFIITDVLGATNIFPFINPIR